MPDGAIFILIVWALFPTIILVATGVKLAEVRRARRWPATTGVVVACGVAAHKKKSGEPGYNFSDTNVDNEPRVEFEYEVLGKKYRSQRITIGEKTAGFELEGILARYPVGASVTVYYNPASPGNAVLERDMPLGKVAAGVGCLLLFFIGGPLLAIFLYFNGVAWFQSHLVHPERAPFVAALTGFGLLVMLFAAAYVRMMQQASRWPVVRGRITSSGVEAFRNWSHDRIGGGYRRHYRSAIVYAYEVHGRQFSGDRISLGLVMSATVPGLGKCTAARYPVGSEVDVHYNPDSPGESVLHPYSRVHYLLWLIGAGMLAFAWAVGMGPLGK